MKTIKNDYCISVKVICASCKYKRNIKDMKKRECIRHRKRKEVKPKGYCKFWEMSEGLMNAGRLM